MRAFGERGRVAAFLFAMVSACNGQFDFDTALLDAGVPPVIAPDGSRGDTPSTSERAIDTPGTGVRIACGASDCLSPGCCTGTTSMSCVDVAGGGTCGGLLIQCDDTEDCPAGQVCCAEGDVSTSPSCIDTSDCHPDFRPQRVHCETELHCRGMNFVVLCNPSRPSPCTQCLATTLTGLPPGYHQCPATP